MADVFEMFGEQAKAPDVRVFSRHYAKVLRQSVVRRQDFEEEQNDNTKFQ
jgi:hypothetical protein